MSIQYRGLFGRYEFTGRHRAVASAAFATLLFLGDATFAPLALAACTPSGPAITTLATVACNPGVTQTGRIGNGPNGAPGAGNTVTVNVNDGATIAVTNDNAISLGNNAAISIGSPAGVAVTTVRTTTNGSATGGQYGKGDNTIEFNNNSIMTIYKNGQIIAAGTQQTAEAINPIGAGNTILNYGLIKAGASSAIFFENVSTNAASPRNAVDNFGTIDARGGNNPQTGGEAVGSYQNVGIDIKNETGAYIYGNLDLQGGNDTVTLEPQSVITGSMDGGGGTNVLTLDATATSSDSVQGVVKNFQTLNKTGAGTWTLTGSIGQNSGAPLAVVVDGGTLVLTGSNTNFNGTVTIDPGATLEARAQSLPPVINDLSGDLLINQVSPDGIQPNDGTYAGTIMGPGVVTKVGVGTLTLTGASTYSGGTLIDQGAIAVGADLALGASTGPVIFNGGTLKLTNSFNLALTRPITLNGPGLGLLGGGTIDTNGFQTVVSQGMTGVGGLTVTDSSGTNAGVAILTGANTYGGGTTISAGTLQLGNGGTTGSILGSVVDNGNLAFNRSNAVTFPGLISGTGTVTQKGTGSTTLTAANTYSGGTLLAGGTLVAGVNTALGTGALTVAASAAGTTLANTAMATDLANSVVLDPSANLIVAASQPLTLSGTISGAGELTKHGAAQLTLTADNIYLGGTTINSGILQVGNGGATGSLGSGSVLDDGALVFNRSGTVTVPGAITGSGSLTQQGVAGGALVLTGANTYSGGTTIASGVLQLGNGGTMGSIIGDVVDNASLVFDRSDTTTFAGNVSGSGQLGNFGAGTTILTGANSYTGGTLVAAGAVQLGDGGSSGSILGDVSLTSGTLIFNRADLVTFPGIISGAGGSVVQAGTGTTILTANNTYTAGTTITAGTLQLGNGGATGSITSDTVVDGGNLAFDRSDTFTVPYLISGTGNVSQIGTGTTILTADNIYTGTTTISAGTLQLGNGGTTGSILGNVVDNGALVFDRSDVNPFGGYISGTGSVTQAGSGTTILTASNTYSGGTTIIAGTLQLGNAGTSGSIVGNVADNGILAFNRSDIVTFGGVISGSGDVNQIGTGTTILNAVDPYTGSTNVLAGALAIGDAAHPLASLSGAGPVNLAAGATLGGYGSVAGDVTSHGTVAVADAFPAFGPGPTGSFTIGGNYDNEGLADLAGSGFGNALAVNGNYGTGVGAGRLELNTLLNGGGLLSNQVTDRLLIFGNASGSTAVAVNAYGQGAYTSVDTPSSDHGISLVQVAGNSAPNTFLLAGGYVTGGTPYQYRLYAFGPGSPNGSASAAQTLVGNAGANWDYRLESVYVSPIGPVPPTPPGPPPTPVRPELAPQVPNYISIPTALFSAGLQDIDSLHRRLGEIRDDQTRNLTPDGEIFIRAYGSSLDYQSNRSFAGFGFDSNQDYAATQFGANWIARSDAFGTLRLGLAGSLGKLWVQPSAIDGSSTSAFDTETLKAIATYQARSGWYLDAIVSGGLFNGSVSTTMRGEVAGLNGTSLAASLEGGYPIPLGFQGITIEPQAQLVYQHLDFGQRFDSDLINVDLGGQNAWVFRGGARLTKQIVTQDGSIFTPYLKANVLQGFGDGGNVEIGNVPFATGRVGTSVQFGAGATGSLTKAISIYGDVSWQTSAAGSGFRGWAGNGGVRYAF